MGRHHTHRTKPGNPLRPSKRARRNMAARHRRRVAARKTVYPFEERAVGKHQGAA